MYNCKLQKSSDLGSAFQTLLSHVFIKHNGCIIEKCGSTYVWGRKCYPTLDAAKAAIDSVRHLLRNSIVNPQTAA